MTYSIQTMEDIKKPKLEEHRCQAHHNRVIQPGSEEWKTCRCYYHVCSECDNEKPDKCDVCEGLGWELDQY